MKGLLFSLRFFLFACGALFFNNHCKAIVSSSRYIINISGLTQPTENAESYFPANQTKATDSLPEKLVSGDTLYCKDSKKIICKVVDIETNYIAFQFAENSAEVIMMPSADVMSIHFQNGFVEDLNLFQRTLSDFELYSIGVDDGNKFYNGRSDFRRGVFDGAMTYLFYAGLVLYIIDLRKDPVIIPDPGNYEQSKLLYDNNYREGYLSAARQIRKRKLTGGYFTGLFGLPFVIISLAAASAK